MGEEEGGRGFSLHDAIRRATERTQVDAVLHVVLLELGKDVFSIRVLPQRGNVRPDLYTHTHAHVSQKLIQICSFSSPLTCMQTSHQ